MKYLNHFNTLIDFDTLRNWKRIHVHSAEDFELALGVVLGLIR